MTKETQTASVTIETSDEWLGDTFHAAGQISLEVRRLNRYLFPRPLVTAVPEELRDLIYDERALFTISVDKHQGLGPEQHQLLFRGTIQELIALLCQVKRW